VLARELGSRFVLDSSGTPLRLAVRGGVYLIKPSLRELAELVGRPLPGEPEQEQAARELVHSGESAIVVISLGAEGALLVWSEGSLRLRTPPGVPVQSKVGAGDSLVAGLVLGLAQGRTLPDSFQLGVAAGTASVLNPGTALCSRADTDRFYEQIGRPVA
jgi:6-phosphofructokinase 2